LWEIYSRAPNREIRMLSRRRIIAASALGALAFGGVIPRALAQATDKLVRMIVGFPAGGGTDVTARVLAEALHGTYASTIIVENKAGASARLAVEYVKNAPPDGSVMLFTPDFPMTLYPHSFKSLSYDPLQDFIAVSPAAKGMLTFVVGPAVPDTVKTLADFVQWCKANPAKANYATTSAGATPHFTGVMLASEAAIPMSPVHYRAGDPGSGRRSCAGQHQPRGRGLGVRKIRIAARPGGDRRAALAIPARYPDHEGIRLQHRRGVAIRRVPSGQHAGQDRWRVERRHARGVPLQGNDREPRQVGQCAGVSDACRIHRND
jgi:hypothetical protein